MSGNTVDLITLNSFSQPIIHLDADAYFTSVEQAIHPELKGRPVVTGKERGIVACASYEAKALGVSRPMRLFEARQKCPQLICLPSDYETYSLFSKRLFSVIRRFTPVVEEYSIDEAFAELSGLRRVYRTGYAEIAKRIKDAVQRELGITVSVGLSSSKTLAKLASKENKPDGFKVVRGWELHRYLETVALERVCGFGPSTVAFLEKNGIHNVLQFVKCDVKWIQKLLGKIGMELWHELRGEVIYPLETREKHDYASISRTKTFTPPSENRDFVRAQLLRNLESAFIKLRRHQLCARRLTVFLRDHEFSSWGMEGSLSHATSSIFTVVPLAKALFEKIFVPGKRYRLTGVVLNQIEADGAVQYGLFDDVPKIRSFRALDHVIDEANELYGKHALHLGTTLWLGRYRQHQSERGHVPKRKAELLRGETTRQRVNIPMWQVRV